MPDSSTLIGQTISHYRVLGKLGGGGMGVVYKAEDIKLARFVALKFLPDDVARHPDVLARFQREAKAASALNHANICTIHEIDEVDDRVFIVMECLDGATLKERIQQRPKIEQVLDWGIEIADALQAAHTKGIVHRDIKPANIFITDQDHAKILDFGLAKLTAGGDGANVSTISGGTTQALMTVPGAVVGTLAYMSPEQARGEELDSRTDIFSFGAVLYEMATGRFASPGNTAAVVHDAILNRKPIPLTQANPQGPPELGRIVDKAMEKDRKLRYQSAAEMRSDLQRLRRDSDLPRVSASSRATVREDIAEPAREKTDWKVLVAGIIFAAAVAFLSAAYFHFRSFAPKLTDKDTIVLADFANSTGDPIFDDTLKQGLAVQLAQSPMLNVLPEQRVRAALKEMTRSPDEALSKTVTQEVCVRTGSRAYIAGSIADLGGHYVIGLNAIHCASGETLAREQTEAGGKQQVLTALSTTAAKLRKELGESLSSIQKYDVPLAQATTSSLEALKAYSFGLSKFAKGDGAGAAPLFQQAIDLDGDFAMAYTYLGHSYEVQGQHDRYIEPFRKAFALRNRASEREKFDISVSYYQFVTNQTDEAVQMCELWAQTYPRDFTPHRVLGFENGVLGNYDRSLEEFRKAQELDPTQALPYAGIIFDYLALNRLAEADSTFKQAQAHKVDVGHPTRYRYSLAFLEGNKEMMTQLSSALAAQEGFGVMSLLERSNTEAYFGRLGVARALDQQAEDRALREGGKESVAEIEANAALREAQIGNFAEARRLGTAAKKLGGGAPMAMALVGETDAATKLVDDMTSNTPPGSVLHKLWLPEMRAAIELKKGNPTRAVELLAPVTQYEAGWFNLYTAAYLRGEAYLSMKRGHEAGLEFQKVLDHRGVTLNSIIGPLAHLQSGRAYALQGDVTKAKAAYKDFLNLWKDADPDIPILKDAKSEYAKLQ
jgi:eukaryotic-like serine/threonine-protein kinase